MTKCSNKTKSKVSWVRPSADSIKVAAAYFLDVYMGHTNGKPLRDAVWTLLYGMSLLNADDKFIHEELVGGAEIPGVNHNSGAMPQYQTLAEVPEASNANMDGLYYTVQNVKDWYEVKKALEENTCVAVNYLAFIATTCVRLITKEEFSVASHIMV